jgi:hypothetical protein
LVIDAVRIERVLKWSAVPLALVVAFFAARYSDALFGTNDTGLDLSARTGFVDATAQACLQAQSSDPAGKAFSQAVLEQYCRCYASGVAGRLSDDDLKTLKAMDKSARTNKMQPIVEAASAPCLEALPKAN